LLDLKPIKNKKNQAANDPLDLSSEFSPDYFYPAQVA